MLQVRLLVEEYRAMVEVNRKVLAEKIVAEATIVEAQSAIIY